MLSTPRPLYPFRLGLPRWPALLLATGLAACAGKTGPSQAPTTRAPAAGPTATPATDDDLAERLERLAERLEHARVEHHIPGMAVAVVKGDEIIFAQGFGHADLATKREVTPTSLFAIGSTSKAFTSAMVAMQVEAGKMAWDAPITTYVPELQLQPRPAKQGDPIPTPTVRDMLSHRSGFTRMSLLWINGALSVPEMLAQSSKAEPLAAYGEKFLYNNVTYASAGEAAARTADTTWAAMLQARIFEPLGMGDTNVTVAAATANPERAVGYRWREVDAKHEAVPMRSLAAIAPAGAINSTVLDMSQWLRMQLSRGTYEGKTMVSSTHLQQTWQPNIEIGSGWSYGMGWMLGEWEGHRVVEHGGNVDGYAAEVAMAPDDDLAFVLLTNISGTPLQRASINLVFETLLGDPPADDPGERVDPAPYVGTYIANFGPFKDARFEVTTKGGALFVDVPGQTNYELRPPNERGEWEFVVSDAIKVSFEVDESGRYQVMHMHQNGMDFEMPRTGYRFPAEVTRKEVADQLGRFRSADGKLAAAVRVDEGRLVAAVDGQMAFVLRKPGADGRWHARVNDALGVSFRRNNEGNVDVMVLHRGPTETVLNRVEAKEKPLPSLDELLGRAKARAFSRRLSRLGPVELTGTVRMPSSAVEGKFRVVFDDTGRFRMDLDMGKFGHAHETYDGEQAWSDSSFGPPTQAKGKYLRQAMLGAPLFIGDWRRDFMQASVDGRTTVDGTELVTVTVQADELPPMTLLLDPAAGHVVSVRQRELSEGSGATLTRSTLSDYRKALGLRIPHHFETRNDSGGATIFEVEAVTKAKGDPATLFARGDVGS